MNAYLVLVAIPKPGSVVPLLPAGATAPPVGRVYPLGAGKNLIGRHQPPHFVSATIDLPWLHVSRRHAQIAPDGVGVWEIEDLQSRNGTCVNGQVVRPATKVPLSDGDRIGICPMVADIEFHFCFRLGPALYVPQSSDQDAADDEEAPVPLIARKRDQSETMDYGP